MVAGILGLQMLMKTHPCKGKIMIRCALHSGPPTPPQHLQLCTASQANRIGLFREFYVANLKKYQCRRLYLSIVNRRFQKFQSYVRTICPKLIPSLPRSTLLYAGYMTCGSAYVLSRALSVRCETDSAQNKTRVLPTQDDAAHADDSEFDWKLLLELLTPEAWFIFAAVVSALIVAALNIQIPIVLGKMVNLVTRPSGDECPQARLADFFKKIKQPAGKLIYMYISQSAFTFLYISTLSYAGERFASRLRMLLFSSILRQDVAFFDKHKTGELISRLTTDVQEFKSSFKLCVSQGLRSITQAIGCVVSLYLISPKMTCLMMVLLPAVIFAGTSIGNVLRMMSKQAQSQIARATSVADEAIGNIRTVRAFAMEEKEQELYEREVEAAEKSCTKLGIGIGIFQGMANLTLNGIVLGVLCAGGSLLAADEITPGSLMAFLVATQTIQRSLTQLSLLFGQFVRGIASGARVFQYINDEPGMHVTGGHVIPKSLLRGEVKFDGVTFAYPTRPHQVILQDFTLRLPPGKVVALCGLSGGGKSTIAALLERFYDVSAGFVRLDGIDIRNLDPSWLRGQVIGFINQEPVLFATTVMENIRYGRPDATDEEVIEAAKLANAHAFIENFPHGYQTVLGERGVTVSGGQKQRIAIARALIKDPKILILDEATSALDAESEKLVQDALDHVVKGRTVLIIAHRLSTIQNADIIAVLARGKIVEIGNHRSLRRKKGIYWELIRKQQFEEEQSGQGDQEHGHVVY